jgi:hypothetical protein
MQPVRFGYGRQSACTRPHGIFNKSEASATSLFRVAPTRLLKALFDRICNVQDPREVMRIAGEHGVDFLPPPG